MQNQIPSVEYATKRIEHFSNSKVQKITRFTTGNCHFVYDVVTSDGRMFVPRIAFPQNKILLEGALFWNKLLRPKGIPLPKIYHFDLEAEFPYLILERFKGVDLWQVYAKLNTNEKKDLAKEMAKLQSLAKTLPKASSFGDSIQTMGLTKMALIQDNHNTDYIDFWAEEMNLNEIQQKIINLYATMACVDFISEIGQQFNSEEKVGINYQRAKKLHSILKDLMQTI